ncbi:MAG TPA: efflux transporter outer membrane subunit [Dyella sp.]|uniref:efflux transporter outer membrane subunit n=1 Tax=Dyella sp. TaxID=1869338 RepID=UPI002BE5FEE4|nr:efflux transporter outer membrane subunit [Dyella sp.]HTV86902.1 efflux transporter outer membrane subunit [Dyella sp.]
MRSLKFSKPVLIGTPTLAFCVLLAGCATSGGLHPTGSMLDARSLKSQQSLAGVALSPTAWPAQDWWIGLGDQQLTQLIDEALQNNPTLAQAQARAKQAQAVADSVDAARAPQAELDALAEGARLSNKDPLYPSYALGSFAWAKAVTANFSWDLDIWGGKRDAWEAALGRSRAADIDAYAARIELSVNVARAYVHLGYAFALRDVADGELQRSSQTLTLTRRLFQGGLGTSQQLEFADAEVASAEQQKAQADRDIDAARSSLAVLLGQGPDRGLSITRPHMLPSSLVALPDRLNVDLLGRRADLVAARWQVEAASKDIKAAKTQFLPNISLSAMAGVVAVGDSTNVFQLPARTYSVGPALSLPIFDGGQRRSNLAGADARYDEAVAHYNSLLIGAVNEVSDLVSALNWTRTQITWEKRAKQDAQKSWQDAMTAYKAGVSGPLTPLASRQQLLLADQRLATLESQQADLSIRLIDALGGGYGADASTRAQASTRAH